jgi:hypothetical protein
MNPFVVMREPELAPAPPYIPSPMETLPMSPLRKGSVPLKIEPLLEPVPPFRLWPIATLARVPPVNTLPEAVPLPPQVAVHLHLPHVGRALDEAAARS